MGLKHSTVRGTTLN